VVTFIAIGRLVLEVQRATRTKTAWRSHKPATSLPFWKWMLVGQGIMKWTDSKRPYIGVSFIRLVQSKIAVLQCVTTEYVFTKGSNVADKCIGARAAVTQSRLAIMTTTHVGNRQQSLHWTAQCVKQCSSSRAEDKPINENGVSNYTRESHPGFHGCRLSMF